jgi:NADPH:quinone reductase-like Zn-dependent oxidoreductase
MAELSAAPKPAVKKIQYAQHGPSSVLQLVTEVAPPARKRGQVLVDNRATSVNPVDYKASPPVG